MSEPSTTKVTPGYKTAVTKFADEQINQRFLNDSIDHAKLLAGLMIGRAKESADVLIYSEKLPSECFGDAISNSRSENIRIILDDKKGIEEINKLPDAIKSRIQYRVLETSDGAHFWVAGNSFRLEMDHGSAKAIANFNDYDAIETLSSRFEKLWLTAK